MIEPVETPAPGASKRKPAKRKPALKPTTLPESTPESPWKVLPLHSDKDMLVEACAITGFGKGGCLLRFRVNGKVTGQTQFIENFAPKKHEGIIQLR